MLTDDCLLCLGLILEADHATAIRIQQRPVETKTPPEAQSLYVKNRNQSTEETETPAEAEVLLTVLIWLPW